MCLRACVPDCMRACLKFSLLSQKEEADSLQSALSGVRVKASRSINVLGRRHAPKSVALNLWVTMSLGEWVKDPDHGGHLRPSVKTQISTL